MEVFKKEQANFEKIFNYIKNRMEAAKKKEYNDKHTYLNELYNKKINEENMTILL